MADTSEFKIDIPNVEKLSKALKDYHDIAYPVLVKTMAAVQAKLANHTNATTVPIRSRGLVQNWGFEQTGLQARWYPKQHYARYVQEGTRPHIIVPRTARVLASKDGGGKGATYTFFGKRVNHPGTKANPFMDRILAAAAGEIGELFLEAHNIIMRKVANP